MLLLLLGCPGTPKDSASACLDEAGGYGDQTADDLAAIEAECLDEGGTDCTAAGFIEEGAATCLAEEAGLTASFDGSEWRTHLVYHHTWGTVVWNVSNLEYSDLAEEGGSEFSIHATTGEVLEELDWVAME